MIRIFLFLMIQICSSITRSRNVPELEEYARYIDMKSDGKAVLTVMAEPDLRDVYKDVNGSEYLGKYYLVTVGELWDDHRVTWDWFFVSEDFSDILWQYVVEPTVYTLDEWRNSPHYNSYDVQAFLNDSAKPNWKEDYADYMKNSGWFNGFYVGDINGDDIPELVIRYNDANSGAILYYANHELQVLDLNILSLWEQVGCLAETGQIIFLRWYGHTYGTHGGVEFFLYDWTQDGYIETRSVIRESGYIESYRNIPEEEWIEHYGQGYINGEEVGFGEFETALTDMYALLERSTWFPITETFELEDFLVCTDGL